jgi:two-component system response regulator ChvI
LPKEEARVGEPPSGEAVTPTTERPEPNPIRVLLVEDDEDYRQIVEDELSWHGFSVCSFTDGPSLLSSLGAAAEADVIVLDWRLPKISGIDLLTQLRECGVQLPVVFLTSHAQIANEKEAFARGAIDFMDKTRGVEILARRLRLVGNPSSSEPKPDTRIAYGKLLLKPDERRAYWKEIDVGLTTTEYAIVDLLVSNAGDYQTYRAIYDHQYYEGFLAGNADDGYRTNVRTSIKRIRRKFCELDPTFAEIETSNAVGYRWLPDGRATGD